MRKNKLIALIGTLTMAAAGLAAVSAGVSSKKADSVSASTSIYLKGSFDGWGSGLSMTKSGDKWTLTTELHTNDTFKVVDGSAWLGSELLGSGATYPSGVFYDDGTNDHNVKVLKNGTYSFSIADGIGSYGDKSYGFSATRSGLTPSSNKITYYLYDVDSLGWQFKAHYWADSGDYDGTTWPGTAMTDLGNGLWSIQISESFDKVIFHDKNDTDHKDDIYQTADLTLNSTISNCFDIWSSTEGGKRSGAWNSKGAPYFIHYDITGATSGSAPSNVTPRVNDSTKPTAAAGTTFEKSGFNFKGWTTTSGGSTVDYAVGATISSSTPGQVITLYPVWEQKAADQYHISYNPGTGSGTAITFDYNVGSSTLVKNYYDSDVSFTAPSKKKFSHWLGSDGNQYIAGTSVGSSFTKDSTFTLTAVWKDYDITDGYWVKFDSARPEDPDNPGQPLPELIKLTHNGGTTKETSQWIIYGAKLIEGETFKVVRYEDEVLKDYYGTDQGDSKDGSAQNAGQLGSSGSNSFVVNYTGAYDFYFNDLYDNYKIWIPAITYQVTYHANNSKTEPDFVIHPKVGHSFTTAKIGTGDADANFTAPTGKVFKGWNTKDDGTGTSHNINESNPGLAQNQNLDLYAMWGDPVADGMYLRGSFDWTAQGQVHMDADSTVENQFVAKGIKLEDGHSVKAVGYSSNYESWIDATSAGVPTGTGYSASVDNTNAKIAGNRGVFNVYVKTIYNSELNKTQGEYNFYPLRVIYDSNGGEGTMTDSFPTGSGYVATVSTNTFTHADKLTFGGWNTASDGTGTWYEAGDHVNFSTLSETLTEDVKLYAIWKQNVTLNDNQGHGGAGYIEATPGKTIPNLSTLPERTGYSFTGYWTNNDGTGTQYYDEEGNGLVTFNGSVSTLYAGWSVHTNTVSFDLNGAPDSLQPESVDLDYGECLGDQYPDLTNRWAGHTFEGWYYEDVTPAIKIESTTPDTIDDDIELVAHWSDYNPSITINIVGGSYGSVTVNDEPYEGSFTVPYNSEYVVDDDNGFIMIGDEYEIAAIAGDGSPEFEYTFDGWSGLDESGYITEDTVITATFSSKTAQYTLSYGGSDYTKPTSPKEGSYNYGTVIQTSPEATKANHHLEGWYTNSGLTQKVTFPYTISGNVTLYPNFILDDETITITISGNYGVVKDGSGNVVSSIDVPYGSTVEVQDNGTIFIMDAEDFEAYLIPVANDGGDEYLNSFTGWTGIEDGDDILSDITITANFSQEGKPYTLSWDFDEGTPVGSYTSGSVAYGTAITYPTDVTGKTGYTFAGWDKTLATMPAEATKITALFTANSYNVTFNANGGEFSDETTEKTVSETYDSKYQLPADPSMTGHTFAGWFTDPTDGTQVTTDTDVKITSATTLYAHWTPIKYDISFIYRDTDGTIKTDVVPTDYGRMPEGPIPQSWEDETYSYRFTGEWKDENGNAPVPVTGAATYTAQYEATLLPSVEANRFITWFNEKMAVCDEDGHTDESALATAWNSLWSKSSDVYTISYEYNGVTYTLSNDAKLNLAGAKGNPEGSNVEKFAFAYDYICGKYNLENFLGRNIKLIGGTRKLNSLSDVPTSTWIIAAVAIAGIAAVGVFFIYRKRKEN